MKLTGIDATLVLKGIRLWVESPLPFSPRYSATCPELSVTVASLI
jgi:hypothetical protein